VVASAAGNIIGETLTFVTNQVDSAIHESPPQAVKSKQQFIEFHVDFNCPLAQEALTTRASPIEGERVGGGAGITVSLTLNPKGVIDFEPIASGRLLLPVEATSMENISIGFFPIGDERTEIAIAKISVELTLFPRDDGIVAQIIKEVELLMVNFVRDKKDSADGIVVECLQRFHQYSFSHPPSV
jgi:hypothetical protein